MYHLEEFVVGAEESGKRDKKMQRVPKMNQRRRKEEGRVVEEDKRQEGKQDPFFDLRAT